MNTPYTTLAHLTVTSKRRYHEMLTMLGKLVTDCKDNPKRTEALFGVLAAEAFQPPGEKIQEPQAATLMRVEQYVRDEQRKLELYHLHPAEIDFEAYQATLCDAAIELPAKFEALAREFDRYCKFADLIQNARYRVQEQYFMEYVEQAKQDLIAIVTEAADKRQKEEEAELLAIYEQEFK